VAYIPDECGVIQRADDAIEELNHRFRVDSGDVGVSL
jgi:hypothetical protein